MSTNFGTFTIEWGFFCRLDFSVAIIMVRLGANHFKVSFHVILYIIINVAKESQHVFFCKRYFTSLTYFVQLIRI